uniref:Uncharacterized protein n=1 Tax=Arundo donax TaxID=35708 RepID=A0A0A8YQY9_ARUDO
MDHWEDMYANLIHFMPTNSFCSYHI